MADHESATSRKFSGESLAGAAKRLGFGGIAAVERMGRLFGGGSPSLESVELAKIRNFIIPLTHPFLGSAVHETPLIEALRSAVPEANIIAAGSGIGTGVYQHHPGLSRLEPTPNPNSDFRGAARRLREIVRSFNSEPWCALFTTWNSRSRVALAMMIAGNGVRAGYAVAPQLVHLPLRYDREQSQIANNLRLMGVLGHPVPDGLEPRIYFGQGDLERAQLLLSVPTESNRRPVAVLVTETSPTQRKKWRTERFVESAHWLTQRHDCRIVLVGTAGESAAVEQTRQNIGGDCISLAGQTTIPVLAAVLALADVCLTLDSGILHVVRSVALPCCIIAPAWSPVHEWLPIGNPQFRILKNLDWPVAPADYIIDEVSVAEVCATLDALLGTWAPSVSAREFRVQRSLAGARTVSGRSAQPLQTSG